MGKYGTDGLTKPQLVGVISGRHFQLLVPSSLNESYSVIIEHIFYIVSHNVFVYIDTCQHACFFGVF